MIFLIQGRFLLLAILLIGSLLISKPGPLYAQESRLEDAAEKADQGKFAQAAEEYFTYLLKNGITADSLPFFESAVSLEPDAGKLISYLGALLQKEYTPEIQSRILTVLAETEERLGYLESAQKHFQSAYRLTPEKDDLLFRSTILLYSMGQFKAAKESANLLRTTGNTAKTIRGGTILLLLAESYLNTSPEAEEEIQIEVLSLLRRDKNELGPGEIFQLYRLGEKYGNNQILRLCSHLLATDYPKSPEHILLSRKDDIVSVLPAPYHFLGLPPDLLPEKSINLQDQHRSTAPPAQDEEEKVRVQLGSFQNRENALRLQRELEEKSIASELVKERRESENLFYKVLTPPVPLHSSQEFLTRLKSLGYEAFLLFPR